MLIGKIYRFLCYVNNEKGFLMGIDLVLWFYLILLMIYYFIEINFVEKNYLNKKLIVGLLDEKKRCWWGKYVGKLGLVGFFNCYFFRIFV